jgi:hypothetical protein
MHIALKRPEPRSRVAAFLERISDDLQARRRADRRRKQLRRLALAAVILGAGAATAKLVHQAG